MDDQLSLMWDMTFPPIIAGLGLYKLYRAYVLEKQKTAIANAHVLSDDEKLSNHISTIKDTSSFVGVRGQLRSATGSGPEICWRQHISEIDSFFFTHRGEVTTGELPLVNLQRSYGRSLKKFGRTDKEVVEVKNLDQAKGFESLFVESERHSITRRSGFDIFRFTEEVLLAGTSVTIFAQLDFDGNVFRLVSPLNLFQPFIVSRFSREEILELLQVEIIQQRRGALFAACSVVTLFLYRRFVNWLLKRRDASSNRINRSYNNVALDPESTCVVCLDQPRNVLLVDCGHIVLCEECCNHIVQCPVCRVDVHTAPCRIYTP